MRPNMEAVPPPIRIIPPDCVPQETTHQLRTIRGSAKQAKRPACVPHSPHLLEHLLNLRSFWPIKTMVRP
jgi:hypothetical protein